MKKSLRIALIVAASLIVLGAIMCGAALGMAHGDWSVFNTGEVYERKEYTTSIDKAHSVKIKADIQDITIKPSEGDKLRLSYGVSEYCSVDVAVKNGVLTLDTVRESRKSLKSIISIGWDEENSSEIILELPKGYSGDVSVESYASSVDVASMLCGGNLNIAVLTGDVSLYDMQSGNATVAVTTGAISVDNCDFGSLTLSSLTGDVTVADVTASAPVVVSTTNGRVELKRLTVDNGVIAKALTGDIELEDLSALSIELETTTGAISGSIRGELKDFAIISETTTGETNLPTGNFGDKPLSAKTTTGDIDIEFHF